MDQRRVLVKIPASTANLGPGFDSLGMALSIYSWVEMSISDETRIDLYGEQLKGLPRDKSNLIYKMAQLVFKEAGVNIPEIEISMYSDIPLTRGLGSSATAIVGGLVAANRLIGNPLSDDKLFQIATELEGHPDNVGASLFGGIIVAAYDGNRAEYIRIEPDERLITLVAIPDFYLSTEKARHALPSEINMADAVFNVGRSSLLVAALASGRLDMIANAMQDRLHQPYRAAMIPGMEKILARASSYGALGAALSGAGPTLIAFVDASEAAAGHESNRLEIFLKETLEQEGIHCETLWLAPCSHGATVVTEDNTAAGELTFMDRIKGDMNHDD